MFYLFIFINFFMSVDLNEIVFECCFDYLVCFQLEFCYKEHTI